MGGSGNELTGKGSDSLFDEATKRRAEKRYGRDDGHNDEEKNQAIFNETLAIQTFPPSTTCAQRLAPFIDGESETSRTNARLVSAHRLGTQAGRDLAKDAGDRGAKEPQSNDRDDRNEYEDQRVLDHALAFELLFDFRSVKTVQRAKILNHS